MVNPTRIAGPAFDAHEAAQIRQTARILAYANRIRTLAHETVPEGVDAPRPPMTHRAPSTVGPTFGH